jgi:hypothetical protein
METPFAEANNRRGRWPLLWSAAVQGDQHDRLYKPGPETHPEI